MSDFFNILESVFVKHFSRTVSVLSLTIAVISSFVSYIALRRDSGEFSLSIYLGSIWERDADGGRTKTSGNYLCVTITNNGRRPLVATNIGGDYKREWWKVILNILPFFDYDGVSMVFDVPEFWPLVTSTTGETNGRLYEEGHYAIASKKLDEVNDKAPINKSAWKKLKNLHVFDSTGEKHFLGAKGFKKLLLELEEAGLIS
jgi:hypothetical protein